MFEIGNTVNLKHGMDGTKFYRKWDAMKQRCLSPNHPSFKNYGGRGITVCDRWLKFENFRDDMNESYLKHVQEFGTKNTTIERRNNNLGYSKDNCKWATQKENNGNKRSNRLFKAISPEGKEFISRNQKQFAQKYNLQQCHITGCLKKRRNCLTHKGWKFEYIKKEEVK